MTLLEVRDVTKRFRLRRLPSFVAVDSVSLTLERGRTTAIVGESGAGKSTLGRMIVRLIEPDTGTVHVDGQNISELGQRDMRAIRRTVQMIFQDPFNSMDPRFSIGRSVSEPLKLHSDLNRVDRERRAVELLERVGLGPHHVRKVPRQLSGGQLQRAAIARALAVEPSLIVCDEPVAALDASIRAEVLNLMLDLQESTGLSFLFITHDLATVQVIAHELLVMQSGRVVEHGPVSTVFSQPSAAHTIELLQAIPRLELVDDAESGGVIEASASDQRLDYSARITHRPVADGSVSKLESSS